MFITTRTAPDKITLHEKVFFSDFYFFCCSIFSLLHSGSHKQLKEYELAVEMICGFIPEREDMAIV